MTAPTTSSRSRMLLLFANAAGALASVGLVGACGPRISADAPRALHPEDALVARATSALSARTAAAHVAPQASAAPAPAHAPAAHAAAPRPTTWLGVTSSPRARGVLAAWSSSTVALSIDGGATFKTVFASRAHVDATALDAEGALFVVRGHKDLSVRAPDGKVTHHALAFAKTTSSLATGAGTLAWLGTRVEDGGEVPAIALSKDDGAKWTFVRPPELGSVGTELAIDDDGTLRVMTDMEADCGGGFQARYVGTPDGATWKEAAWPLDTPDGFAIGARGFAYGIGDCGDGTQGHLCAVDAEGHASAVAPVQAATFKDLHAVTSGSFTWATIEGTLSRFDGATVTFPATSTPKGFVLTAIDADGQPVGTAHGKAMRWGRDGKWETLFAPAIPTA
jgi:hypothetical protein